MRFSTFSLRARERSAQLETETPDTLVERIRNLNESGGDLLRRDRLLVPTVTSNVARNSPLHRDACRAIGISRIGDRG